jgi:hypothetical protein
MFVAARVAGWFMFDCGALIDLPREHDDTLYLMPCLVPILAVFFPRLVIIMIAIFTRWFSAAFDTALWPMLGLPRSRARLACGCRLNSATRDSQPPGFTERFQLCFQRHIASSSRELAWRNPRFISRNHPLN